MQGLGRKVILDKSFLQAESKSCRRLRALRLSGCTLVLTDTLVYELCTGSRETQWVEARRKLWEFADAIEVWRHTGELLRQEVTMQVPVDSPLDHDLTVLTRSWFQRRTEEVPENLRSIADAARRQREVDSVEALIRLCRTFCGICSALYRQVRRSVATGEDLGPQMDDLVNQERVVRKWVGLTHGRPEAVDFYIKEAEAGLGPDWFAYHHARRSIALWCVFLMKYGENDTPGKEFRNTKLDADYAALLHYADALATNETSGSLSDICSWLYRGSKKLFSISCLDEVMPGDQEIRTAAYARWERRGREHGNDLSDWFLSHEELLAQTWDRL